MKNNKIYSNILFCYDKYKGDNEAIGSFAKLFNDIVMSDEQYLTQEYEDILVDILTNKTKGASRDTKIFGKPIAEYAGSVSEIYFICESKSVFPISINFRHVCMETPDNKGYRLRIDIDPNMNDDLRPSEHAGKGILYAGDVTSVVMTCGHHGQIDSNIGIEFAGQDSYKLRLPSETYVNLFAECINRGFSDGNVQSLESRIDGTVDKCLNMLMSDYCSVYHTAYEVHTAEDIRSTFRNTLLLHSVKLLPKHSTMGTLHAFYSPSGTLISIHSLAPTHGERTDSNTVNNYTVHLPLNPDNYYCVELILSELANSTYNMSEWHKPDAVTGRITNVETLYTNDSVSGE